MNHLDNEMSEKVSRYSPPALYQVDHSTACLACSKPHGIPNTGNL